MMSHGELILIMSSCRMAATLDKLSVFTCTMRPSYNGIIRASQARNAGSTPVGRSIIKPRVTGVLLSISGDGSRTEASAVPHVALATTTIISL